MSHFKKYVICTNSICPSVHVFIKKNCCHSDSDSDADSFYGSIERPMDIKHPVENADDGEKTLLNTHMSHTHIILLYY